MEERTTVVIDIQLDDAGVAQRLAAVNAEMNDLKDINKELRKEIKAGNDTNGENSKTLAENEARLKTLKAEQSALAGQVAQSTAKNREYGTSLKEQSALLNDLRNRYQSLSEEQRNSTGGREMLKQIQDLDAKMKSADGSIGLFQRNVGDYANQMAKISGLFGGAGGAATSLAGKVGLVTKGMGALAATPLIAVLTALVAIVQKVGAAMRGSEEQTMKWREIMAVFEPLIISMKNGLTALAGILINTVGKAIEWATEAFHGLAKAADWVGSIFGKDWGLSKRTEEMKAQAQAQRELTKAENDYIIAKRAQSVKSAEIDRDVAELRAKAVDKEKYNAQQRMAFLKEALDMEKGKAEQEKALAEENLRLLEARAAQTANNAETEEKLAEARRKVIEADTQLAETNRSMTREMNRLHTEIRNEGVAAWNAYKEKLKKTREEMGRLIDTLPTLEENMKSIEAKNQRFADQLAAGFKAYADGLNEAKINIDELIGKAERLDRDRFKIEIDDSDIERLERDSNAIYDFAMTYKENAKTIESVSQSLRSSFGSVASMYRQLADDETKTEEERAKAAQNARRWSALQIAANAGTAVAKGVASAVDVGFPAALPAMATMLAAILAAIAQAKQLAADTGGFATGGVIGGYKGASLGADNTLIQARTGEMVINAEQQRRLFEVANGGTAATSTAAELAAAIRDMPAPVLVMKEFRDYNEKVINYDNDQIIK